ncbi:hypothetical protein OESDEN_07549 [Oesophagostomum dentatum]|uniref:Uncharacterized protein n=1 Tax=Oesophagostomum dentatum TaxID=61180 RepID=A0A0B1T5P7_OESDE|nr:hypothetical protein OESDEN_07549 [Oesophagostomum dentatum]
MFEQISCAVVTSPLLNFSDKEFSAKAVQSFVVYNNGEGAYISEHSSSRTLESNTSLETGIGHSCMAIGGAVLALIFYMLGQQTIYTVLLMRNSKISIKFKKVLLDKHMLLLIPFFAQNGIIVSFLLGVYPTTLMFTSAFSGDYYVVAFYSMSMGVAELSGWYIDHLHTF